MVEKHCKIPSELIEKQAQRMCSHKIGLIRHVLLILTTRKKCLILEIRLKKHFSHKISIAKSRLSWKLGPEHL